MTFQPPPPGNQPPPGSPPPPPPGQWGPPPAGGPGGPGGPSGFDPKSINPLDWGIVGIGAVLFVFSFFDYYSFSYSFGGYSASYSFGAWHFAGGTFVAWFAMVIGVAAAAVTAVALFMPQVKLPVPARLASVGLFALSFVLYVIAIFAHDDFGPDGGHGFSFWLSLVLALAGVALSLMRLQATGGQLPGALQGKIPNIGGYGPQGGISGAYAPQQGYSQQPPPAPGYGPPAQPGYGQQPPPPPGYGPPQ